jgi:hypothetical protein
MPGKALASVDEVAKNNEYQAMCKSNALEVQ